MWLDFASCCVPVAVVNVHCTGGLVRRRLCVVFRPTQSVASADCDVSCASVELVCSLVLLCRLIIS